MCGICGFLDFTRAGNGEAMAATVTGMAAAIAHRGPDGADAWVDPTAGVALGHRRLAIIDLSDEGRQPMHSADGRYVVSYNGEIYNFPELRGELEVLGHSFRGHSDTEIMLAAIVQWGLEAAIGRCVGMFALALWDRQMRKLFLVRDRLGIKPLYYTRMGRHFLFGSELKALRAHHAFAAEIDRDVLALYLQRNWIPAPWSIYSGVYKLPPATILEFDTTAPRPEPRLSQYWSVDDFIANTGHDTRSDADLEQELDVLLRLSVSQRMISDVPFGVFLSGGIDSSTVAAMMQAQSRDPISTFTIGFDNQVYDEARDAKAVAEHLGTDHHELYLNDDDLRAVLPRLPAIYDEPFADSSQIPTFLVSQMARRDVTVCLAGDGGDEMFGGYNRYLWCDRIMRKTQRLPKALRRVLAGSLNGVPPHLWTAGFDRINPLLPDRLRQRDAGDKLHKLARALAADDVGAMYDDILTFWPPGFLTPGTQPAADLIGDRQGWPALDDPRRLMMYLDTRSYLPDDLLTKVDRASMAVSLEVRVPMIDHRVVAFSWGLPDRMLFSQGRGKHLLRQVLYRYVPPALVERPKWGFQVPVHTWLRGPLRAWAEDLLDERSLRRDGLLDPGPIRRQWQQHLSGRRNWQHSLWGVLMFQSWLRNSR